MRLPKLLLLMLPLLICSGAGSVDQAMPAGKMPANHPQAAAPSQTPEEEKLMAAKDRTDFRAALKLDTIRTLLVHHNDQVKILDSWARQSLSSIRNRQSIDPANDLLNKKLDDGKDPLYTALDMAFRPEAWYDQNIIYIQAVPIRQQMAQFVTDPIEQTRILTRATVSPRFLAREDIQRLLKDINTNVPLSQAVNKVWIAQDAFFGLRDSLLFIAPTPAQNHWFNPLLLTANVPVYAAQLRLHGDHPEPVPGFHATASQNLCDPLLALKDAWRGNIPGMSDQSLAQEANISMAAMAERYPQVNPAQYRTPFARSLELFYNHTFNGTIVAFVYFVAFALFAVGAMAGQRRTRIAGLAFFATAVICHILAMSIRWYLAERIPIQNQFESVLGAALIGCVVGLIAESLKRNGLFGMAFSFVGFLAMTCCFVFPFVVGQSIGENIGKVAGILNNTAWLYIHVNTVIASYALIAAAAVLGGLFLLTRLWHWINPLVEEPLAGPTFIGGLLAPAMNWPSPAMTMDTASASASGALSSSALIAAESARARTLDSIDAATVILLQMAFWVLGTGIVFGAIWADVSWGRPWGWDPKETFALVTWIVYLVIIHVRFITPKNRATVTAILAVVGLLIMLFNWIGVNFFLAGLHSYA